MTMTPATLLATAARYERSYGCRKGDGGTADQIRAGAEAMVECERLRAFITRVADVEWQADEPASDWCQGDDAKAYVAEMEHHCNWTVKDARDMLALTKGDTP